MVIISIFFQKIEENLKNEIGNGRAASKSPNGRAATA